MDVSFICFELGYQGTLRFSTCFLYYFILIDDINTGNPPVYLD